MSKLILLFGSLLILVAGCRTTEKTTRDSDGNGETATTDQPIFDLPPEVVKEYLIEEMTKSEQELFDTRSTLADQFATVEQDMPEIFLKNVEQEEFVDQYAGYRVQLLSTRSVVEADSTKDNFRVWADEHIEGYTPEAYVIFRQPYYKVRVGDFRNQQKANEFSRLLKNEFPNAWVVHDRIEPEYLPADTTQIRKTGL